MAPLKKYLVPLTPAVLELLAEGINPTELIKPALMEVDERPPEAKDFIMQLPDQPENWPKDLPDEVWQAAMDILTMGINITDISQPMEDGVVIADEITFGNTKDVSGWFTIFRDRARGQRIAAHASVKTQRGHWVRICDETGSNPDALLRKLSYALKVVAPRIRAHSAKAAAEQAKAMMARFRAQVGEAVDVKAFIMKQRPRGFYVKTTVEEGYIVWAACIDKAITGSHSQWGWTSVEKNRSVFTKDEALRISAHRGTPQESEIIPVYESMKARKLIEVTPKPMDEGAALAGALLCESPRFKTLKAKRQSLSAEEKAKAGDAPIWKAVVDGTTWYVSNTHRAFSAVKSIPAAVREYRDVVEPSG